jgi:hypothetical protein
MEVVSTAIGRVGVLLNLDELLPLKGMHAPDLISLVGQRYKFVSSPSLSDSIAKVRESGLKFELGKLRLQDGDERIIQDLTVYHDGILVTANTTEDAELFLDDLFDWGVGALGLRPNRTLISTRAYVSELVARFDNSVDEAIKQFTYLAGLISTALQKTYNPPFPPINLVSIVLDYDRGVVSPILQSLASFSIERRANHLFTDNVFYCKAPLKTSDHISILEEIESYLHR